MTIEIPAALQWVSYLAGSEWPKGDETAMFNMGDDWNESSQQLAALIPDLQQVTSKALSVLSGDTGDAAAQQFQTLFSGDYSVQKLVTAMSALGSLSRNTGTQIEYTKLQVLSTLAITAAEITYLIAMADWTFGMTLFEIPAVEGITIAVIRTIVTQLVRRLLTAVAEALTKTAVKTFIKKEALKLLGAALREAVEETVISEVQEFAIEGYQWAEGHRDGFDAKQLLEVGGGAALGAFTASLLHGPLTHALGTPTTIGGKVVNGVITHYGLGFVGNAVGSAATGGVDAVSLFLGPATGGIHGAVHGLAHHGTGEPHGDNHKPDDSAADTGDQEKLGKDDSGGNRDSDTETTVGDDEKEAKKDQPLHDDDWGSDTATLNGDPRGEPNGRQSPVDGNHSSTTPADDQSHGVTTTNGNAVPSRQEGTADQNGSANTFSDSNGHQNANITATQPSGASENGNGGSRGAGSVGDGGSAPQHAGNTGSNASTFNGHSNSPGSTPTTSTPHADSATTSPTNVPGKSPRAVLPGHTTESSGSSGPPSRTSLSGPTPASRGEAGAGNAASRGGGGAGAPAARSADAALAKTGTAGLSGGRRDQTLQAAAPVHVESAPEPNQVHGLPDDAVSEPPGEEPNSHDHSQDSSSLSTEKRTESHDPDDDDQVKEPRTTDSLPRADTSIDEVRSWLRTINSDIYGSNVYDRMLNCGPATIAVFDRLSGRASFQTAPPLTEGTLKQHLRDVTGFAPQRTSLQGIEQTLRGQGAGAHAVVFVARRGPDNASTAHTFNAFFDGAKVYALDGQDNSIQEWPPNFDAGDFKAVEWSVYAPPSQSAPHPDVSGASASTFRATDVAFGSHGPAGTTLPHEQPPSPESSEESDYPSHSGSDEESAEDEGNEWDNQSGFELDDEADFLFDDESESGEQGFDHEHQSPEEVRAQRTEEMTGHLRGSMKTDAAHRGDGILGPDLFGTRDPHPLPEGLPFINADQLRTTQLTSLFDEFNLTGEAPRADLSADALEDRAQTAESNSRGESMPAVVHAIWLGGALPQRFEHNLAQMAAGVGQQDRRLVLWTDVPREAFESASRYIDDPLTEMLDWARENHVAVLNVDEFFSAQAPMVLHEQYGVEMDKLVGRGYAAASDILRLEILHRFGGLYTDVDNEFVSMEGISELFRDHGFAVHNDGGIGNSALLAARGHDSIGTALTKIEANYRLTQEELYAQHGWPYRHEAAEMREAVGQEGQGALRRHSIFARTGPNAMGATLDELGYRREHRGDLEYPDLPRIETNQFTMGQANSWLRPVPLSAERRWSDAAAVNIVAPKVVSTLLRQMRNRPGDLYLTAVAPVIEGTPNPPAVWDAVLNFINEIPGVPESIKTVTHRVVFEQAGDLARRNIPDYVLQRFGLGADSPGQWVLGEMQSNVAPELFGGSAVHGQGPGDEPPSRPDDAAGLSQPPGDGHRGRPGPLPPDSGHGEGQPPHAAGRPETRETRNHTSPVVEVRGAPASERPAVAFDANGEPVIPAATPPASTSTAPPVFTSDRPSAQLNPAVHLDSITGIPSSRENPSGAMHFRSDDNLLFRDDTRSPERIFRRGFAPSRPTNTNLASMLNDQASAFVSTTRDRNYNHLGPSTPGEPVYRYLIYAPGGIDINATFASEHGGDHEEEVAFPGGIRTENIVGAHEVVGAPTPIQRVMGTASELTLGPFTRNERFNPTASNSHFPVQESPAEPRRDESPPPDSGRPGDDSEPANREDAQSNGPREAWGRELDHHAANEGSSTSRGKRHEVVAESRLDAWDRYVDAVNEHYHAAASSERGDDRLTDFELDGARRDLAAWGITDPDALLPAYRDMFAASPHEATAEPVEHPEITEPQHDSRLATATPTSVDQPPSVHEPPRVEPPRAGDGALAQDHLPPPYPDPAHPHDERTEARQQHAQPESRRAGRELVRAELEREDLGEGVPIPPPYSATEPGPPYEGYRLQELQFGRPAPRPEAFGSTLAEVRRRLQTGSGDQLPDDVDDRITTAYDIAVMGLHEDLRRNYVRSGWSPTLLRELHHRVGEELGLQHPPAPLPIDPAAPRPGGRAGLPPDRADFPGMVAQVRARLADRFRELPPDIDDLIAIAYEQLPESPRNNHALGFSGSAVQAMYDRVKSQLNQAQTPRRNAVTLRRLMREARSGPSTSESTSDFGIPERRPAQPRPADPGPAEPRPEKSEVVPSRFVTPRTTEPGPSQPPPEPGPSQPRPAEPHAGDPPEPQRSSISDGRPEPLDDEPAEDHREADVNADATPTSTLGRRMARLVNRRWAFGNSRFGESPVAPMGSPLPTPHTAESLAVRYPWLDEANPQRDSAQAATNCVVSAFAFVISEREGESFQAPLTDRLPGRDLVNFHRQSLGLDDDQHQVSVIPDFDSAAQALKAAGPGAMAMIAIGGEDAEIEHVYVAVVDGHGVSFLDPHRGTLAVDPDDGRALAMLPLTEGIPLPGGARLLTSEEIEERDDQTRRSDTSTPTVVGTPLESEDPYFKPFHDTSNAIHAPEHLAAALHKLAGAHSVPETGEGRPLPQPPAHEPLAPIPHSGRTIEEIRDWIEDTNLGGDPHPTSPDTGPMVCGPATLAVFHWLSGTPVDTDAHLDSVHPDDVGHITGLPLVPNTGDGIVQRLKSEGPGAHTVIAVRYRDGDTHSFNAYYDGHQVYALDGQRGTATPWPPKLDRQTNPVQAWFMGTPFHGDESRFSMLDRADGPAAGTVPQRTVLRGLPPDDPATSEDQAPHADDGARPDEPAASTDHGAQEDSADQGSEPQGPPAETAPRQEPLRPLSDGRREAWARELEAQAGGAGSSTGKGKQRAGAPPAERLQAWDRYVDAFNEHHHASASSQRGDDRPADSELDSARRDLGAWGITDPEALLPAYRVMLEAASEAPKVAEPKDVEQKVEVPKAEVAEPKSDPPQPVRIGSNLVLSGIDVLEEFRSGDQGLEHIKQLVIAEGGDKVWQENEKQLRALFSDDGVRPKVPGMLRGGQTITHTIHLGPGRAMTVELAVNGADKRSQLDFKENTKYEFEHTSDSTNTVGFSAQGRRVAFGGVQGNVSHPKATETAALFVSRAHDKGLTELSADRQVSGAQTAEAAVRFQGSIQATITHRLSSSPEIPREHELSYRTQVVVPARDVKHGVRDVDLKGRQSLEPQPGSPDKQPEPTAPRQVEQTHRLNGSDVVTNLWMLPDDPTRPAGGPRPQAISEFLAGSKRSQVNTDQPADVGGTDNNSSVRDAFEKAYGKRLADEAIKQTEKWLTVERLQANLHGMSNKQPLVLDFKGIPGGRLVVHAFIEPLGTSPARGQSNHDGPGVYRMMRATGETAETEFHHGTEADSSQTRQDAVTWSRQLPIPGRARGQGGSGDREAQGGLDGLWTNGDVHSETESRQFRVRNTMKTPAAGQAWHGQARLRFEMHAPGESKVAVHETRARFDVLTEKSEITPTSHRNKEVWAPPQRIWGDRPPAERNSAIAKPPWWRLGPGHRAAEQAAHGIAKNLGIPASSSRSEERVPALRGLGSMDRVTNLDLSGFHGMLDSMGRRAFGSGWKDIGPEVSKWYHLNRVRGAISSMSQHSPLTRPQLSGKGSKTKVSFTADFEQLTYKRVVKTLSSPSMEITEGTANTTEHNRQILEQGALGGRGGDVNDGTVLGEVIAGANQTIRDNDRVRNQQRIALATKFEQEMAIFEGWVRLDGTMTGSKAIVHESGLFPVEIAIPVTELQGSRTHDADLPPTFTRHVQSGFVDEPVDPKPVPEDPSADPQPSTSHPPGVKRRPDLSITPVGFRPAGPGTDPNLIEFSESPTTEAPFGPRRPESPTSPSPLRSRFDSPAGGRSPAESRPVSPAPSESPTRQSTTDSRTPLMSGRQDSDDSSQGRRSTGDTDVPAASNPFVPRPTREVPLSRQVFRRLRPDLTISPGASRPASPTSPARSGAASPVDEAHDPEAIELTDSPISDAPPSAPWLDSPTGGRSPASSRSASPGPREGRRSTDEQRDNTTPFVPERGDHFSPGRQQTVDGLPGRDSLDTPTRESTTDSTTALVPRHQDTVDSTTSLVPHRQDTADSEPQPWDIGPWTSPGLRDIADNHRPPPIRRPDPPDWEWTKKAITDKPELPSHALLGSWHPSDMLVGVDPASGLIEAFRQDLEPALGGSVEEAMTGLSSQFGPRVLPARLTHESGQTWSHDIAVPGGKITVKVRPERLAEGEYVGPSGKFETDLSIESQSSTAQSHGASLRATKGGRLQVPVPHGSVAAQVTHTGSIRPKEDIEGQGVLGLSGVNTPTLTGDIENRVPLRTRTTQAHALFRQPIRFHISYEQHVFTGPMKGIPEAPQPVRLHGVFSYAKEDLPTAPGAPTTGGSVDKTPAPRHLDVDQTVVKIRPHVNPPAPQPRTRAEEGGERGPDEPVATTHVDATSEASDGRTPDEDLVAAHVLDSMAATGKEVFGNNWPAVRAELAKHVKTIAIQRDLGDYSRGATRSIDLKSVPGGNVVLRAHLDTMAATDSKATTEFYTGGQESMTSTVSTSKSGNWQGYLQGQVDVLPVSGPVNLSVLVRVAAALGFENTDVRNNSSATGILFRKKVATLTHGGTATLEAKMSRPPGGSGLGDKPTGTAKAQVDFVTRESPTDNPAEDPRQPRKGIIQTTTDVPAPSSEAAQASPLPQRGLSHDSIVRKIVDGGEFRANALRRLSEAGINGISDVVDKSLNDTRLASKLPDMTRVVTGDGVELLRQGKLRITARADVQHLEFTETEKTGGNAYVLNDVNQAKQNQRSRSWELGIRALFGPRVKGPGVQGYVLFGGGATVRQRFDTIDSAAARVSANAKFARSNVVFDATTRVFLSAHDGDTQHSLGPIDVHGPILIPESETEIVTAPKKSDEEPAGPPDSPPQPVDTPPAAPEPGRIETRDQLATQFDRIAGPERVVPTADDPRGDPQACTILLDKAVRTLYPDRLATLPATGRTLDDSVLDGRPVSRLIGGAEPAPISSWPEVATRLNETAGPDGRATALILVQHANGIGHAVGAHRFANGEIAYFDLHRDYGDRVLDAPPEMSLARASAVILDGEGRDVTQPRPKSSSLADALTDPVGDPRYGRGGVEAEYRGGYLVIPQHLFDPNAPDADERLNEQLGWLARNEHSGIKIVVDTGVFDVTEDNTRVMVDQGASEDVRDQVFEPVAEFVTSRPIAELRTDAKTNTPAAVQTMQHNLIRLDDLPRPEKGQHRSEYALAEILPREEGWEVNPLAEEVKFVPVTTGNAPTVVPHHTKGVPLGDVKRFMRRIAQRVEDPELSQRHHDGEEFARSMDTMFRHWTQNSPAGAPDRPDEVERRELYGAMWLTYLHVSALALATTSYPAMAKHRTAVALRQSLRTVHDELSSRSQDFLSDNADVIRETFERQFLSRETDFSRNYVAGRKRALRSHAQSAKFHVEPPQLSAHDEHRPLQAIRYAPLEERHSRHTLTVGDYLDTMLLRNPGITVNQYEALGVHSHFPDLDRDGSGPGLMLLELRNDIGGGMKPERLGGQYTELTRIVRDTVEPSAAAQLGRSLTRAAKGVRNFARSRFEPEQPLSGAEPQALLSREPVAAAPLTHHTGLPATHTADAGVTQPSPTRSTHDVQSRSDQGTEPGSTGHGQAPESSSLATDSASQVVAAASDDPAGRGPQRGRAPGPARSSASVSAKQDGLPSQPPAVARSTDDLVLGDTSASSDASPPEVGPASRLRGGAGEGAVLRQTLKDYARRIFGTGDRPDHDAAAQHTDSDQLIEGLKNEARRVQQAQTHPVAEDRFGLDPFGFRNPAPRPIQLRDIRLADVPTDQLGSHIRRLDMAGDGEGPPVRDEEIWSQPVTGDARRWPERADLSLEESLPTRLEMPKVVHSIWLGGPVTDGRKVTDVVRQNLEKLSTHAKRQGMRVVLWTDVPRSDLAGAGGDAARMRTWARDHDITLLSPDEVFHVDEPMNLATEYRLETAKATAAGYTAASDILRLEILHRFGGVYTDHDNEVRDLVGVRNLLAEPGFALHSGGRGLPNNSAMLAARRHPFIKRYLETIRDNYRLSQDELHPQTHRVENSIAAQREKYVAQKAFAIRRRSVTERTGPFTLDTVIAGLGMTREQVPRISTDQLRMGTAHTWLSTKPRRFPPEQTPRVLQHAISGLIWDLHNRRGDLNLAAVAPLIEGLPDPAVGWEAVVGYIHSVPQLRTKVRSVTYSYLRPRSDVPVWGTRGRPQEIDLPPSVLEWFGLPRHGHAMEAPGVWRRAAFGTHVQSADWGPGARDNRDAGSVSVGQGHPNVSSPSAEEEMRFNRADDGDSDIA